MDNQNVFKILIEPTKTIEQQLFERAHKGKCVMAWWDADGNFISWMPDGMSYPDKLIIIDSFQRRLTDELNAMGDEDE